MGVSMSLSLRQLLQFLLYMVLASIVIYSQIFVPPPEIELQSSLLVLWEKEFISWSKDSQVCDILDSPTLLPTMRDP